MMTEYLRARTGVLARRLAKSLRNERGAEIIEIAMWIAIVAVMVGIASTFGKNIVTTAWQKAQAVVGGG